MSYRKASAPSNAESSSGKLSVAPELRMPIPGCMLPRRSRGEMREAKRYGAVN